MQLIRAKLSDTLLLWGILAVLVSTFFYCVPYLFTVKADNLFGLFIPNFLITAFYFLGLLMSGRLKRGREGLIPMFLFLILFLISAYSLNREMSVFQKSVSWFSVLLVLSCINYIAFSFYELLPAAIRKGMLMLLGVSLVMFVYLSCYLLPLYPIGAVAFLALGISLHVFVPLLFTIYTLVLVRKLSHHDRKVRLYVYSGSLITVGLIISFVIRWSMVTSEIDNIYQKKSFLGQAGLPGWINVAKQVEPNSLTEKVLKSKVVYTVSDLTDEDLFWSIPERTFGEELKHDPLITTASLFAGYTNIPVDEKIRILESVYDARHEAEERFWRGDQLFTEQVNTNVRIWPQYGMSYTEKLITVTQNSLSHTWRNQQEAIYTFMLPEGAVITALSLWIEGKEEKAILTSKQKATKAYNTIVGVEMRDPSVVHWQEGNRVTVRVFPVMKGESRMFKLGITAPLARKEGKMVYENVWFKGPAFENAQEESEVTIEEPVDDIIVPALFEKYSRTYKSRGNYKPNWSIKMKEQPLSLASFSFNGKLYQVRPYDIQRQPANINNVYLDINHSWTDDELESAWRILKDKNVFVYTREVVKVTDENKRSLFNNLRKQQFSLFPLFEIKDAATSLLITKSAGNSPNLKDLEEGNFSGNLKTYLKDAAQPLRLFNLGGSLSPYLKTLKEYRAFEYEAGNTEALRKLLQSGQFARSMENENQVVLDDAGIAIVRTEGNFAATAPDHLMRLFAYNHIMQQKGKSILEDAAWDETLVKEAQEAYVVSPVSSLIVLESQKDYERFGIDDTDKSLYNASSKSTGASPEPHEWALILLAVLVVSYVRRPDLFKTKKA